jgi:hypothetical protein
MKTARPVDTYKALSATCQTGFQGGQSTLRRIKIGNKGEARCGKYVTMMAGGDGAVVEILSARLKYPSFLAMISPFCLADLGV